MNYCTSKKNKTVTRKKCTGMAITLSIIKQIHALAKMDKMPKGLNITSRTNIVIFDFTWIAEVDYDKELFDND